MKNSHHLSPLWVGEILFFSFVCISRVWDLREKMRKWIKMNYNNDSPIAASQASTKMHLKLSRKKILEEFLDVLECKTFFFNMFRFFFYFFGGSDIVRIYKVRKVWWQRSNLTFELILSDKIRTWQLFFLTKEGKIVQNYKVRKSLVTKLKLNFWTFF